MIDAVAQLNDVQQHALDSLQADGIAILRFQDLFGEELWEEAVTDVEPFIRETHRATFDIGDRPAVKEEIIVRRFYEKRAAEGGHRHVFSLQSPWIRYAASQLLLDIVNAYGGDPRRLFYLDNWFTVPYPRASERVATQRWHRDPEDEHILKVFVYFSDVDEEAGPFEYVRSSSAGGRHGHLWSWEEGHRYAPADEFDAVIPPEDRLTMTGPPGTMIICDTGGFHRGGAARTKPRILSVSSYIPPERKKGKRRFEVDYGGEEGGLPPQVRFALS